MAVNLDGMKRNRRARYDVLSEDNLKGIYSRMTEMLGSPEVRGTLKSDESQALQDAMLLVVRGAYAKITKTFPSQNGRRPFPVGPRRFTKQSLTDSENEILAEAFDIASRFRIPIPVPVSDRTQFRPYAPLSAVDAGGFLPAKKSKRGSPSAFERYMPRQAFMLQPLKTSKNYPEWGLSIPAPVRKAWDIEDRTELDGQEFMLAANQDRPDDLLLLWPEKRRDKFVTVLDIPEFSDEPYTRSVTLLGLSWFYPPLTTVLKNNFPVIRFPAALTQVTPLEQRLAGPDTKARPVYEVLFDMNGNFLLSRLLPVSHKVVKEDGSRRLAARAEHLEIFNQQEWMGIPFFLVPDEYRSLSNNSLKNASMETILDGIFDWVEDEHISPTIID